MSSPFVTVLAKVSSYDIQRRHGNMYVDKSIRIARRILCYFGLLSLKYWDSSMYRDIQSFMLLFSVLVLQQKALVLYGIKQGESTPLPEGILLSLNLEQNKP